MKRIETQALRGIAILGIVLHNYCHFLGFAVKENEFKFDAARPEQFIDKVLTIDTHIFVHLFSFLGHYGVPVFLFLSGYGLVVKYERGTVGKIDAGRFMLGHYMKLFRLMIVGYVVFIVVYCIRSTDALDVYSWDRVVAQLTMTINFLYEAPNKVIKPGPYWFFGLMLQLYALYALVYYRLRNPVVAVVSVAICWVAQLLSPTDQVLNYMRYNFIGGVLPFVMGIMYGRYGRDVGRRACVAVALLSAVAVVAGGFLRGTWLWVPVFVVSGAVATVRLLPSVVLNGCAWIGGLSAALFTAHPVVREVVVSHYRHVDIYFGQVVYLLASVALAMLFARISRIGKKTELYAPDEKRQGIL